MSKWFESLRRTGRKRTLTPRAKGNRLYWMEDYLTFNNGAMTPDELIAEAKANLELVMDKHEDYSNWLRGEEVKGHKPRDKKVKWNSACTGRGIIRGFYSHNDVIFPKRFKEPKREQWSEVSKRETCSKTSRASPFSKITPDRCIASLRFEAILWSLIETSSLQYAYSCPILFFIKTSI